MDPLEVLFVLDQRSTLALTAWGEARRVPRADPDSHSPVEELIAVMWVVRNRRPRFTRWRATDASYKAICLAPAQFSCWNATSGGPGSNHDALMAQARILVEPSVAIHPPVPDPELGECLGLADAVIAGVLLDHTGGADSYYAPAAMSPPGRVPVGAVGRPQIRIGDQYFYIA
jgi:hypothetical protein